MKEWLKSNWDKALGFFMSIIVAGLVGYFSSAIATAERIAKLEQQGEERARRIEAIEKNAAAVGQNATSINSLNERYTTFGGRIDAIESRVNSVESRSNLIESSAWSYRETTLKRLNPY